MTHSKHNITCTINHIIYCFMCFSMPPPWVKKLRFFTEIQPLNFLMWGFLISETSAEYSETSAEYSETSAEYSETSAEYSETSAEYSETSAEHSDGRRQPGPERATPGSGRPQPPGPAPVGSIGNSLSYRIIEL